MRIVHYAPFAPNACGLYEAARDMVIADFRVGHEVHLVDVGVTINNEYIPGSVGKTDSRGGTFISTSDPAIANNADILIAHTGIPDNWIVANQVPIIWIMHGRPAACFRPEQFKKGHSYSLMYLLSKWPRIKKMVTFWKHHIPYWEPIIPKEKLVCLDAPPVDQERFSPNGPIHDFGENKGKWNVLIADSWREDVDIYEVCHGLLQTDIPGLKVHFYAMEIPLGPWEYLLQAFREKGILGEVQGRMLNMEEKYRAADVILSPHKIATRVIIEGLSCGIPIIANGCDLAQYRMVVDDPYSIRTAIQCCIDNLECNKKMVTDEVKQAANMCSLSKYNEQMNEVYRSIVGG